MCTDRVPHGVAVVCAEAGGGYLGRRETGQGEAGQDERWVSWSSAVNEILTASRSADWTAVRAYAGDSEPGRRGRG